MSFSGLPISHFSLEKRSVGFENRPVSHYRSLDSVEAIFDFIILNAQGVHRCLDSFRCWQFQNKNDTRYFFLPGKGGLPNVFFFHLTFFYLSLIIYRKYFNEPLNNWNQSYWFFNLVGNTCKHTMCKCAYSQETPIPFFPQEYWPL